MTCQSTQGYDSSGYIRTLWESDDDRNGHAAIFEVKFGKKTERAVRESRERSAEQLFDMLEPVALSVEGSYLGTAVDPFEPTARCINDTEKRRLVIRSGLQRLKCCVCHLHQQVGNEVNCCCSTNFQKQYYNKCVTKG